MEANGLLTRLWRVQRRLLEHARPCLEKLGTGPKHVFLLAQAARGKNPGEIARTLHLSPPSVSHLLGDLEGRGWIRRRPDPKDRRRLVPELTPEGHRLLEEARRCLEAASASLLERLDPAERRSLLLLLAKLEEADD